MDNYSTIDLENKLYEFIIKDKERLNHYGYVADFINYLNNQENGKD